MTTRRRSGGTHPRRPRRRPATEDDLVLVIKAFRLHSVLADDETDLAVAREMQKRDQLAQTPVT